MIKQLSARLAALPRLPVVLLVLLVVATFWLDKAVRPPVTVEDDGLRRDPDYMLEGLSVIRTDHDGAARYTLFAKKMLHYSDDNSTHLEQPRLINAAPGKPVVQIKADQGELPGSNDDVYLSGNVTLLRNAGNSWGKATMITSSLHIIPDDDIAKTDRAVTITEGNTIINAVGMELDNRASVTRLLSQVKVVHDKKR